MSGYAELRDLGVVFRPPSTPLPTALNALDDVDGPHAREAAREAIRRTHPDRGGDETEFRKVQRARELLGV